MNWLAISSALALAGSALAQGDSDPAGRSETPANDAQTSADANQPPANSEPVVETLAMQTERFRRMTVPVTIKGQGPFDFMVDTGAQATVLSSDLAEQLELFDREGATLVGMASARQVETTMIPEFALGSRLLTIRTAPIVEGRHIGGADGILGLDSLQDQRVLLDFENGELHISDNFENGGATSYDIVVRARERLGQLIIHRAEIDGVTTAVIIDTGAQGSVGNLALQERMNHRMLLEDAIMTDVNGVRIAGETRVARRLEMDRVQLNNIPISFADSPTFHGLDLVDRPALILGMSELRMFRRVAIDFRSRRVLFDIPGDVPLDTAWNFNERASRLN